MNRKELILHLMGEISSYMLESNPMRLVLSLHQEEDGLHLSILDDNEHTDEEIAKLEKTMNSPKRPELAGYYGAMTGIDFLGSARLDLLGWQIKHADISKTGARGMKIDLWLGGDKFESHRFNIPKKKDEL